MSIWESKLLGDLCSFQAGGAFPRSEQGHVSGDYPFIKVSDMTLPANSKRIVEANNWVSIEAAERMRLKLVHVGAVAFAKIGEGLKAERLRQITRPTAMDNNMMAAVPMPAKVDERFLLYLIESVNIASWAQGSALPYLSQTVLSEIPVRVPGLPEQRAIAATLGAFDDKIESNRRAVVSISDLLDAQSEKYGADLPTVPLGVIVTSVKDTVNPSKLGDAVVDHFSFPAFDSGARPERVAAATIKSNKLKVPRSAVLLSRLNPRFNRTWWASAGDEASALASTEFLVLASEDDLELAGVWLAVRDPFFREELPKRVTGTSGSHQRVRPDDVLAIEVPDFRSTALEVKQSTHALLMRAESLRMESDRLTALRDALLPELLSGRIRVPVEGGTA